MCAVIGCYLKQPTKKQIEILKKLFVESQIRGRHATGYSMIRNGKIFTQKVPLPAETFVHSNFAEVQPGDYTLQLIGHTRYSTSDLRFNQPLQNGEVSIVHNGVITQDPPELWDRYGYSMETSNDSELLLRSVIVGNEPLVEFSEASMAVAELSVVSGLRWYRNAKRPLYSVKVSNGYFVCSTRDIASRAGLKNAVRCSPGVVYTPRDTTKLIEVEELIP
jgi:glutamine phosphoribosylpyrophosphate amidotransferase